MTEKNRSTARKIFDKVTDWITYAFIIAAFAGGIAAFTTGVMLILDQRAEEKKQQQLNEMIHDDRLRHIRKNKIIA